MNRDIRTQPFATELLPPRQSPRETAAVTEQLPTLTEQAENLEATQVNCTLPVPQSLTEPRGPGLALTPFTPANLQMTEEYVASAPAALVADSVDADPIDSVAVEPEPAEPEPAVASTLQVSTLPAEPLEIRPPNDSEPLRQLDRLTALVEEELRKSNPAYRAGQYAPAVPSPVEAASPEEESLQSYLDRFMERVTGKKPEPAAVAPTESPVEPSTLAPAVTPDVDSVPTTLNELPQSRETMRAPECRQSLAAMRDLANENARSAVAIHAGLRHWRKTRLAFMAAVAASAASSVCAAWHLASAPRGALEVAVCAGILAGLLAGRFFLRCRRMSAPIAMS